MATAWFGIVTGFRGSPPSAPAGSAPLTRAGRSASVDAAGPAVAAGRRLRFGLTVHALLTTAPGSARPPVGQRCGELRKFARTARRDRTVQLRAGGHLLTAEDPLPADLHDALARISGPGGAHEIEPSRVTSMATA